MADLLQATERGIHCEAGGFYIDPWQPVERAVITHAHADHARPGSGRYLCAAEGAALLRRRLGEDAVIDAVNYGERLEHHGITVSFHPAGHLLGSAQVRVEHGGEVWVVSGDYKTAPDATCTPFEPVRCDVFITESTFGLPIYRWPPEEEVFREIHAWWRENQERSRTCIIYAYALGKAQRLLAGIDSSVGPILAHGAVGAMTRLYAEAGIAFPPWEHANDETAKATRGRAMVIAPISANATGWTRRFGPIATAFASGWMTVRGARRHRSVDRGFVLSDHVDWPSLLAAIDATGAQRIGVTHGFVQPVVRWLLEHGRDAFALDTRYEGEPESDAAEAESVENRRDAEAQRRTQRSDEQEESSDYQ